MSTLAKLCAFVAALSGLILLGSVSPASAYQSLSLERDIGENLLVFSESTLENTTIYYGVCGRAIEQTQKECFIRRVRADFSGGSPKEDECNVVLRSESGGFIESDLTEIEALGKDRAIVRWFEKIESSWDEKYHMRFSIVNFSDCTVKTTKLSKDLSEMFRIIYPRNGQFSGGFVRFEEYNGPQYLKREDDFDVLSLGYRSLNRSTIDAEGIVSKIDTLLTFSAIPKLMVPMSTGQGYLIIEAPIRHWPEKQAMTVAHIQSNGQRQNLTHIEDVDNAPFISLANGLIGICAQQNDTTMMCTQFKLGDKEINWFPVSVLQVLGKRAIYNLPEGEGFLTHVINNEANINKIDQYLIKIGLDGKPKQFVKPDLMCQSETEEAGFICQDGNPRRIVKPDVMCQSDPKEAGFTKLFEDDRGNYCLSATCVRVAYRNYDFESSYIKLHSKCFEPKDFKNISKYLIEGETYSKKLVIE